MSRPTYQPTDDQVRILIAQCAALCERFPVDERDHRPFTRAFVRAVYHATGKTFGPGIYRRLMDTYGPGRHPSNDTFAAERRALDAEIAVQRAPERTFAMPIPAPDAGPAPAPPSAALREVLDEYLPQLVRHLGDGQDDPKVDFLKKRLAASEQDMAEARAHAARLAAQLQEQTALATSRHEHLVALQATLAAQTDALKLLASEVEAMRRHSLLSIDAVRGETRIVQERCARLEVDLKHKDAEIDMLRMRGAGALGARS